MKFSRQIRLPASVSASEGHQNPLLKTERHLKTRNLKPTRDGNTLKATLFAWSDLFSVDDADRLSWESLEIKHEGSALHFRFRYNWHFQAFAHLLMSCFVVSFMNRFGSQDALFPMLASMNAVLVVVSFVWAQIYAKKFVNQVEALFPCTATSELDSDPGIRDLESA
jgi:hypothetical protein